MIGGDPVAALRSCNDLMRCIRISALTYEDIETNVAIGTDAAKLYGRTEKAGDGSVDALLARRREAQVVQAQRVQAGLRGEQRWSRAQVLAGAHTPLCFNHPIRRFCTLRTHWRPHTGQGLHRPEKGHQREP